MIKVEDEAAEVSLAKAAGSAEDAAALWAVSPIDGRYRSKTRTLSAFFSEAALIKYRLRIEAEVFVALMTELGLKVDVPAILAVGLETDHIDLAAVKQREATTNHDVKAVEYHFKAHLEQIGLGAHIEKAHLGLTSEDVNNLSYALMQHDALHDVLWPALVRVIGDLRAIAKEHRATPMLARTHGQAATPTTVGKEFGVFLHRLVGEAAELRTTRLPGKLGGATGTHGALHVSYPDKDWIGFSRNLVESLGLRHNPVTTQVEPHDGYAALYDRLRRICNILLDLCQDVWLYVSAGYLRQRAVPGEVGSSAMPHKINPIDFENAEGNLGLAIALFDHFSSKLTRSRLQRDLSDSTVLRNVGVAFGHLLVALDALTRGLGKISVDEEALERDLEAHPEVLAEAYQTIMRIHGVEAPYEKLKTLTRGERPSLKELRAFAAALDLPREVRRRLTDLTPRTYVGLAPEVADVAIAAADGLLEDRSE